jgi:hypothetical protein
MTVTLDGSESRARGHSRRTSATFATPLELTPKPLRVRRIDCRLSLRNRDLGCPTLRPLHSPERESNQFRMHVARPDHARTNAADATSPSHSLGVDWASVTARRCTSESLPAAIPDPDLKDRAYAAQIHCQSERVPRGIRDEDEAPRLGLFIRSSAGNRSHAGKQPAWPVLRRRTGLGSWA